MGQMVLELEQNEHPRNRTTGVVPGWVPRSVQNYIDHTEMGVPIRALARQQGCHASTILRQIRRVETLRDDPLVDGVLKTLGGGPQDAPCNVEPLQRARKTEANESSDAGLPDSAELGAQSLRVLRRLSETGAVLAVAAEMEKAVIVRDSENGQSMRTGVVDRGIAEAMALKGWIATRQTGRITRYYITSAGRGALSEMMACDENARAGVEGETPSTPHRIRYGLPESPLAALARRRDRDGTRFLSREMVHAGERLREDFEMAQMAATLTRDWDGFMNHLRSGTVPQRATGGRAIHMAHRRVIAALQDMGPGLSDVALRCCCLLEGLESTEKVLGWSARSGKIVLRIALMRLHQHYVQNAGSNAAMIG